MSRRQPKSVVEMLRQQAASNGAAHKAAPRNAPRVKRADEPPPQLDEIDAADLAASDEDPELQHLRLLKRPGYLVRGWSHLLAGYPRCGKTELLAECCPGFVEDGEKVLYLTEEPRSIWRQRLTRIPGPWAGVRLVFALGATPLDLLCRVTTGEESVVLIDTIRGLGLMPQDECNNSAVAQALNPWIAAARRGSKTLIMGHHMRKGSGEHGEGIAGGHALLGVVDVALELRRDTCATRRILRAFARVIQPEELIYERTPRADWSRWCAPSSIMFQEVRRRVVAVLDDSWLKTAEVRERLEEPQPGAELVRRALLAEAEAGAVERDPPIDVRAVSGKTVRWRLWPQPFPAET